MDCYPLSSGYVFSVPSYVIFCSQVIDGFRKQSYRILIATDVAARGLDIPHIQHVINHDLPQCPEDYIHRIGRTARAGATGEALNFLSPADGIKWRAMQRLLDPNAKLDDLGKRSNGGKGRKSGSKDNYKSARKSNNSNRNNNSNSNNKRKFQSWSRKKSSAA